MSNSVKAYELLRLLYDTHIEETEAAADLNTDLLDALQSAMGAIAEAHGIPGFQPTDPVEDWHRFQAEQEACRAEVFHEHQRDAAESRARRFLGIEQ